MADPPKTIIEAQAAMSYVLHLLRDVNDTWPAFYKSLRELSGQKFRVPDEPMAALDLALAAVALEFRTIEAHFPADQSRRLRELILHYLNSPEHGAYAKQEIAEFVKSMDEAPDGAEKTVAKRLLNRWLSTHLESTTLPEFALPLVAPLEEFLLAYSGVWRDSGEKFTLVQGD